MDKQKMLEEMSEVEVRDLLGLICCKFHIGDLARTKNTILGNVENSSRRSDCLCRIENYMSVSEIIDGEETEYSLLNWGESPSQYILTFINALEKSTIAEHMEKRYALMVEAFVDAREVVLYLRNKINVSVGLENRVEKVRFSIDILSNLKGEPK